MAEQVLWLHLRKNQMDGHAFRRQCAIGPYVLDFFCYEKSVAIELDGSQHAEQVAHDAKRTAWLESRGIKVLRFWNNQVLNETDAVKEAILQALGPID